MFTSTNNSYVGKVCWKARNVFRAIIFFFFLFSYFFSIVILSSRTVPRKYVDTYTKSATHPLSICGAKKKKREKKKNKNHAARKIIT